MNAPAAPTLPSVPLVHQLFATWAKRAPERIALRCEGSGWTYAQLHQRARHLAWHLRGAGVGPESRVVLCLPRGREMAAAVLGVLESGGAFVPLDPSYPPARMAAVLAHVRPKVVLTDASLEATLRPLLPAAPLVLEALGPTEGGDRGGEHEEDAGAGPASLAYVLFTSGSTGEPKGVALEHRGLAPYARALGAAVELGPDDVWLHTAAFSFSSSVRQLLVPLTHGARVVLATSDQVRDPLALLALARDEGVTTLDLVPSHLRTLLEALARQDPSVRGALRLPRLQRLLTASEALPWELARKAAEVFGPSVRHWNMYGQTETTGIVGIFPVQPTAADPLGHAPVPIGRALGHASLHVLDDHQRPVPPGETGEIHVGGVALARGYLQREDLTAERFRAVPPPAPPGTRLYQTGDLGRWRPDGTLEFLGRTDDQVKVRGMRVELGEVEAALRTHPGLREVVVVAREDGAGERALVAFAVPAEGQAPSPGELRAYLEARLAPYMVPSAFGLLPSLPRTPSGKVDRPALPAVPVEPPPEASGSRPPTTPDEQRMAGLWKEVLGVSPRGVEDSFFELGGSSLQVVRLAYQLAEAFGVPLTPGDVFQRETILSLCARIDALRGAAEGPAPLTRAPAGSDRSLLTLSEQLFFYYGWGTPGLAQHNDVFAAWMQGPLNVGALERALRTVVERHGVYRRGCRRQGERTVAVELPLPANVLELVDGDHLPEGEREAQALASASELAMQPLDIERDRLWRFKLWRISPELHLFVVFNHHALFDGSSRALFFEELGPLYAAHAEGLPAPALPPLPVELADYALWQAHASAAQLREQVGYWTELLTPSPEAIRLPYDGPGRWPHLGGHHPRDPRYARVDRTRPPDDPSYREGRPREEFRGARAERVFSETLGRHLQALAKEEATTPWVVLIAGLKSVLHGWSGQTDLLAAFPVSGRERQEVHRLHGCFMQTLHVRTSFLGEPTFRELLRRVRRGVVEALAHQDAGTARVAEALGRVDNVLNPTITFNLATLAEHDLHVGPLKLIPTHVGAIEADHPLEVTLSERGGRLSLQVVHLVQLLSPDRISALLDALERFLAAAVAAPDAPLRDLPRLEL